MNELIDNKGKYRTGAVCSLATGIGYFLVVLCAFFAPSAIASYVTSDTYFRDFIFYKDYFIFLKWTMALINITMIGVITALYTLHKMKESGVFMFLTISAIVGLGIGTLQSVQDATQVPHLFEVFEESSPIIRHVIIAFGVANPAIYSISLGLPGIWFISYSLRYRKELPRILFLLNFLWGVGNILTPVAHMNIWMWLIRLIVIGAIFSVPIWTFFQTRFLWKRSKVG